MFSGMYDEVGRGDISHKCCNVDIVKGSVKHIMFGHGMGCANFKGQKKSTVSYHTLNRVYTN